jgi:hypothetical protein
MAARLMHVWCRSCGLSFMHCHLRCLICSLHGAMVVHYHMVPHVSIIMLREQTRQNASVLHNGRSF